MSKEKPCCAAAAAAKLRYLVVGGHRIAISELDVIIQRGLDVDDRGEAAVRRVLLEHAKLHNYVPEAAEKAYEDALYDEYLKNRSMVR